MRCYQLVVASGRWFMRCGNKNFVNFSCVFVALSLVWATAAGFSPPGNPDADNLQPMQQGIVVTGTVTDETGEPLPGASILVKGTPRGVSTDIDGSYSINVSTTDVLEFSFIGYQTVMVAVENQRKIDVQLLPKPNELDEVTITAFGRQRKESVVSSIETVRVGDLRTPGSNLTTALAGRVAGLISYQTSGEPGADNADFFVRGLATFGVNASPLILIDGFESTTDALARLQPDDIESFSVMKDASASVMYGARGANGIIIVNTKTGREGPAKISFRVDVNVAAPTHRKEVLDGPAFMRMYNEAYMTRNTDRFAEPYYSEQKIQATMRGENPMLYPNVDWYDMLFKPYTINTKTNLNISGGGKVATYYVSGGWDRENGLLRKDDMNNFSNNIIINRAHIRNNVIFALGKTTKLDTRIQGRFDSYNGPYMTANELFNSTMRSNPVDFPAFYDPDERYKNETVTLFASNYRLDGSMMQNPYAQMVQGYEERYENRIRASAALIQDLSFVTEGLELRISASAETWGQSSGVRFYVPYFYKLDTYNQITGEHTLLRMNPENTNNKLGAIVPFNDSSGRFFFEARANWNHTFSQKHSVGASVVGMMDNRILTNGRNFSIQESLPERNAGLSGRLTYAYDSRYFIEGAFGYNGSEKFTGDKTFGFFPSLGVGWVISNEPFWTVDKKLINNLKLKGTMGKVGNDAIAGRADRFFFLSQINTTGGGSYQFDENFNYRYSSYHVSRYANPDITWESAVKYNVGLELGMFNDAIDFHVDFFYEERSNIYEPRNNYPASAGIETDINSNSGRVHSKGIDGSLDWRHNFNRDFWIMGRSNFTYATNKIIARDEPDYRDRYRSAVGHSTGQRWGLVAERLFVDELEIANSPRQFNGEYAAGDMKYVDVNNDGIVNVEDNIPMGYSMVPEIQYGFGMSLGYKKFDFSFFFQGSARVSFFIDATNTGTNGIAPFLDQRNALKIVANDYWSESNPNVHAFWPRLSTEAVTNNWQRSSWWLRNGGFTRLKTLEMGYSLGGLKAVYLENARIYFSAENLFVFSRFKLWDPEQRENGLGYPLNRRFNLGLHLTF